MRPEHRPSRIHDHEGPRARCTIRGCRKVLGLIETQIMICDEHSVAIWAHVQRYKNSPDVIEAAAKLHAQRVANEAWADENKVARCNPGRADMAAYWGKHVEPEGPRVVEFEDIYYLKQGDLIKIGYSTDLESRLHSYGPTAVVLATHPGTRADERDLHRTFRPFLASGREWYHPSHVLLHHVDKVLEKHGDPICVPEWTKPREAAHAQRRSAQRKPTGLSI